MLYFATLFDINYLTRGLALYDSINLYHKQFILYIICLDEEVYAYLSKRNLKNIILVRVQKIEESFPELSVLKDKRKPVDYIFTLSPYYPSYLLEHNPLIPFVCTLDVDQYFFSNSEHVFADLDNYSILITPHNFTAKMKYLEAYGRFNVSFQVFKNDEYGQDCLKLWRTQCYDWCEDKLEGSRFADQKYLDTWESYFGNKIKVIATPGLGVAPWNIENYRIRHNDKTIFVNEHRLVLFHYQGLKFISKRLVNSGFSVYNVKSMNIITKYVFKPIIRQLIKEKKIWGKDKVSRINHQEGKVVLSHGMFYIFFNRPISMDLFYKITMKIKKINGIFNKFKNLYRSAR